jgi:CopG family transcriptional regulator, nickel-responsive regulator
VPWSAYICTLPRTDRDTVERQSGLIPQGFSQDESSMQRVTITLDDDLMNDLDRIIELRGYQNRSEAIRDLARAGMEQVRQDTHQDRDCVAAVVYVYDHEARDLAKRLVQTFHHHHDMAHATLHVHLDHESCMEVTVLKGRSRDVRHCAEHVIAERGVRHGRMVLIPVEVADEVHAHGDKRAHRHAHAHVHRRKR